MDPIFQLTQGDAPLLVSVPHAGTILPDDVAVQLTPMGRAMVDTDWFVDRLYTFVPETGATLLVATHSRTVVDLNRSPDGEKLYPGQAETGLCPTETFSGEPLYTAAPPNQAEIARRVATYWRPYHDALSAELGRLKRRHGFVRLLDGHSILGEIPRLFDGALPDLNFGTNSGAAMSAALAGRIVAAAAGHGFSHVLDGRFRGGAITRHYGQPAEGVHAIQLELAQRTYMDESAATPTYDALRAAPLIGVLKRVVAALLQA
jgi:N-formylglutamate deformylase